MKKQALIISLCLLAFARVGFAQDKMEVKDGSNNLLMQVNDEGAAGSVTLPDVVSDPSSTTNKLYNKGGELYFNGNQVGGSGGGLVYGWAANIAPQSSGTASVFTFGNGTGEFTSGNGVTWDDGNNRFVVQQAGLYKIEYHAAFQFATGVGSAPAVAIRTSGGAIFYGDGLTRDGYNTFTATYVVALNANGTISGSVEFTFNTTLNMGQTSMFVTKLD